MNLFNKLVVWTIPLVPKPIVKRFASRYIAGETLDDAIDEIKNLQAQGCCATLDVLGEFITTREEAEPAVEEYLQALDRIHAEKLDSNISVKLTMLGLKLDKEFCLENVRKLVQRAKETDNFVRIDMEDSSCTTDTLDIYSALRKEYNNVGFVIQSYMRRSLSDIHTQMKQHKHVNVRVCKGIYVEPREIAYKDMWIINANFNLLVRDLAKNGDYVGVATHDEKLVWATFRLIHDLKLAPDKFEFQMLLGVDEQLRRLILKDGYRLRVYVPYGKRWYEYSTRRLKENPGVAAAVVKNVLRFG